MESDDYRQLALLLTLEEYELELQCDAGKERAWVLEELVVSEDFH